MKKRQILRGAAITIVVAAALFALGSSHLTDTTGAQRDSAVLFVSGTLGDKSFFDGAAKGVRDAKSEIGISTRIVEGGTDPQRWESTLLDLVDSGEYRIIVTGTFPMALLVQGFADRYPHTRFILFDASVDYSRCKCRNVYSVRFRQNEGAYLAGVLAAQSSNESSFGMVGGMEVPVVNDFLVGFEAGFRSVAPQAIVRRQYVNSFTDPGNAKEIAASMFRGGAVGIFYAAGGSGHGVLEAAQQAKKFVIGVDNDQYEQYRVAQPQLAETVLTSVKKEVDVAIKRALISDSLGALSYGAAESIGLAEGGISIAATSGRYRQVSQQAIAAVTAARGAIIDGRIRVPSALTK